MTARLLPLAILAAFSVGCRQVASVRLPVECLHVRSASGQDYLLRYYGQECSGQGYPDLPMAQYDTVASWAFNAQSAGFLAPIEQFRIVARLATIDSRSDWGFSLLEGSGFWRELEWAEWAKSADLIAVDALKDSALVDALLESPITRSRLGKGHQLDLTFRNTTLDHSVASRLREIMVRAELSLQ